MSWQKQLTFATAVFTLLGCSAVGQVFFNEILFAPPGPDLPCQYLELRGPPNYTFPDGSYALAVAGDRNADPGRIENVFDLSRRAFGGNGFLVLLQKTNNYAPSPNAAILANCGSGSGFGSGSSSSIGHRGRSSRTDLPHASVSFFLIQATNAPDPGNDIDGNNDGVPGGQVYRSWTILDSIGVVKNAGDIGYGAINFRQNTNGIASGVVVPVAFTPDYIGRTGNTTNAETASWLASGSLGGTAPNWILSTNQTAPAEFAGRALDHLGLPNFGAPPFPGIVAVESAGSTNVKEDSGTDSYKVGLNTAPEGPVTVQLTAGANAQVSANAGLTFSNSCVLTLTNTSLREVVVRAVGDNLVEPSPHIAIITHTVIDSADLVQYPLTTLGPRIPVRIYESESLLLNELKINPPGTNDGPCEYVEISGPAGARLTNIFLLVLDGDPAQNPGEVRLAVNLTGHSLGTSGLLVVTSGNSPYAIPPQTTVVEDGSFSLPGGALQHTACSALLVASPLPINQGTDLDAGNNGVLEGLPTGAGILDAVAWTAGASQDILYGGVILDGNGMPPDALARFSTNSSPLTPQAWFFGELAPTDCLSLVFDGSTVSSNFPGGAVLTPGAPNTVPIQLPLLGPLSGVIGDPDNPQVLFQVSAGAANPDDILVTASSSNPAAVPDDHIIVAAGPGGKRTLALEPVGVGYASITVAATAPGGLGQIAFPYAASAMGRPGGRWHTGTCDASTAISLDPDYMLIGDNENNLLRIYDRRHSGPPLQWFDLDADLGLLPEEHGEVNIEASTRCGDRLYFIGAHSNANSAQSRTNRNRLFAVDLSGTGTNASLTFVGRYDYLKPDLIQWDNSNGHGKGTNYYGFAASAAENVNPKAPDGFNIEGLSMAPGSTNEVWIGFRAPIVPATNRTHALIVPVLNFATLAAGGCPPGSAVFGAPIEVDLYNRGFRSLEGTTNGYLICSGPPGDLGTYPNDFRLHTWTGNPADQPQQRAADLTGTLPEGIAELPAFPWTADSQVQLISDNGTLVLYNDGIQNKHLPINEFKKFRSDWVALGQIVKPVPFITGATVASNTVSITWRALKGETYRVQLKQSLSDATWQEASGDILANGPYGYAKLPQPLQGQGFYRVQLMNP